MAVGALLDALKVAVGLAQVVVNEFAVKLTVGVVVLVGTLTV